ncbi:MAG TPA: tetratricopeptide repeat protein [Acidobacteriota bacterium]|nr:tetratricopeptide repeat protein [Acidobacteriota bacterium]
MQRQHNPSSKKTFWLIALLIVAIAIPGGLWLRKRLLLNQKKQTLLTPLSHLDFSGMEPQVVKKIKTLIEQVNTHPESADAWGKLALNLDAHDFKNDSLPVYKEAAALAPSDFRWPYFSALALNELGKQETLEWFERARQINPQYAPLLVKYGDALVQFGTKDEAVQQYQQALALNPQMVHALYGLARIEFANENLDASVKHLNAVLAIDSNFGEAYNLLVSICRQQQDAACIAKNSKIASRFTEPTDMADPVYDQLIAEGESSIWFSFRGSQYFRHGAYADAIREFETALRLRDDAQTHEDLGRALNAAGKFAEAADHYRIAIKTHPSANNFFAVGFALAKLGQYSEAEQSFKSAIEKKPDFAEAYFNLAVLYAKMQRMPDVLENLNRAISINPDYAEAHFYLGQAYIAAKKKEEALKELKILRMLDPKLADQLQIFIEKQNSH